MSWDDRNTTSCTKTYETINHNTFTQFPQRFGGLGCLTNVDNFSLRTNAIPVGFHTGRRVPHPLLELARKELTSMWKPFVNTVTMFACLRIHFCTWYSNIGGNNGNISVTVFLGDMISHYQLVYIRPKGHRAIVAFQSVFIFVLYVLDTWLIHGRSCWNILDLITLTRSLMDRIHPWDKTITISIRLSNTRILRWNKEFVATD